MILTLAVTLQKWHCRPPYLMCVSDFSAKTCLAGEWSNVALPDLPSLPTLPQLECPSQALSGVSPFSSKGASTDRHPPMCNLHLRDYILQFLWKPTSRLWPCSCCIWWMGMRTTGFSHAMSNVSRLCECVDWRAGDTDGNTWREQSVWDCFLLCRLDWGHSLVCPGMQPIYTHLVRKENSALITWQ